MFYRSLRIAYCNEFFKSFHISAFNDDYIFLDKKKKKNKIIKATNRYFEARIKTLQNPDNLDYEVARSAHDMSVDVRRINRSDQPCADSVRSGLRHRTQQYYTKIAAPVC